MTGKAFLHDAFRTGITMKGVDGLLEAAGGVLLWFIKPAAMSHALRVLSWHELSRDPHDFIGIHLLHISERVAHSDPTFASIYLLWHGLAKAGLAIALWLDELWSYPLAISVFSVFAAYQIYRFSHTHAIPLLILTIADVAIIWLTWKEYRVQKATRNERSTDRAL
ncbi:MAG TPA: DUF2127 domain-containing protein [Candidatus Acidoferrales bacterium]|nr:DUF2127 domain-containing protein [Candidatus Acidoferrales bacterium]